MDRPYKLEMIKLTSGQDYNIFLFHDLIQLRRCVMRARLFYLLIGISVFVLMFSGCRVERETSDVQGKVAQMEADYSPPPISRPMLRGIWVASWGDGILNREQCEELVETVRASNMNAIFPEVRKVGDAYYLKGFEPRATNIKAGEDFDPLQYLIGLCHDTSDGKRYIEVHAWCVTFRLWRDVLGDPPPGHLFAEYPETVMLTADGRDNADGTMFADPGHPRTEEWTVRVFRNLAEEYDIDGVHHDYVRYPEYEGDWGYNPVSLERFRERTGFDGTPEGDNVMWSEWQREQVRNTVRRVYAEVTEVNPDCLVSAATLNWGLETDPWKWRNGTPRVKAKQDWVSFMKEGGLDMNCLMNYSRHKTQPHRFPDYTDLALRTRFDRHAIIGPGIYLNTVEDGFEQINMAVEKGADGVLLYAWNGWTKDEGVSRSEYFQRLKNEVFQEPVDLPERPWKDNPVYGSVIGQITDESGEWIEGAVVTLDGVETMATDGTGFYAFFRVDPGEHVVSITVPDGKTITEKCDLDAGETERIDQEM